VVKRISNIEEKPAVAVECMITNNLSFFDLTGLGVVNDVELLTLDLE
jgi:hypothetical protein